MMPMPMQPQMVGGGPAPIMMDGGCGMPGYGMMVGGGGCMVMDPGANMIVGQPAVEEFDENAFRTNLAKQGNNKDKVERAMGRKNYKERRAKESFEDSTCAAYISFAFDALSVVCLVAALFLPSWKLRSFTFPGVSKAEIGIGMWELQTDMKCLGNNYDIMRTDYGCWLSGRIEGVHTFAEVANLVCSVPVLSDCGPLGMLQLSGMLMAVMTLVVLFMVLASGVCTYMYFFGKPDQGYRVKAQGFIWTALALHMGGIGLWWCICPGVEEILNGFVSQFSGVVGMLAATMEGPIIGTGAMAAGCSVCCLAVSGIALCFADRHPMEEEHTQWQEERLAMLEEQAALAATGEYGPVDYVDRHALDGPAIGTQTYGATAAGFQTSQQGYR